MGLHCIVYIVYIIFRMVALNPLGLERDNMLEKKRKKPGVLG